MVRTYEPKDHIQRLEIAPRAEGILDQREITIQSYQTTVPFDYAALDTSLATAWLTPLIRFGVFSRIETSSKDALNVVLGLQDELTIRAYDYDERRPLWYSWQDVIVDTVNVQYFRDESGLVRFTTTGGGRRITDDRLHEFSSAFLGIPKDAVSKQQFDLDKLRDLCFNRFIDQLYKVRFAGPSAKEYESIDHALFQSRKYIDPNVERLKEIRTDALVKIESFDSDIRVFPDELAAAIQVRFFIQGLSGSLRLRFPKVFYKKQPRTDEEQARVFYRLADATVSAILDDDYYAHQRPSLDDLSADLGMFPDMVDLGPFREVMISEETRRKFLLEIDLGEPWPRWGPQLQAINELLASEVVAADVEETLRELVAGDPRMAARLLAACQADARKHRVGSLVAARLTGELHAIPSEARAHVEEQLLSWAIELEVESWDVDSDTGDFGALGLKWRVDDIAFDVLPTIIWKLVGVLHARLTTTTDDVGPLLRKFDWCITVAKSLPSHHSKSPAALRLVAEGRIPRSVSEAGHVLKNPISSVSELDDAILNQFGLPLWPMFFVVRRDESVELQNSGIGAALNVRVLNGNGKSDHGEPAFDLDPGKVVSIRLPGKCAAANVHFEKLGRTYRVDVPIAGVESSTVVLDNHRSIPAIINRERLSAQREYRKAIDPDGLVVGSSPALLEIFEHIHHANETEGLPAVLLLGEAGVGKTHIAELIHKSSMRAKKPFEVVNAVGGGDINIQRGEWIGYGKNHGLEHIEKKGQPGHLMKANGGSLFVDEFASFSHDLQVVFLSVLERRSVQKVGGESFVPDVRCIFATNVNLDQLVTESTFRGDLLDRIPIVIHIPPLRERRGDILLLARKFAGAKMIAERCLIALLHYDWPGNIRELKLKMASAIARTKDDISVAIDVAHVNLPVEVMSRAESLSDDACNRELWTLADSLARNEGFERGSGLQRRAGEILGVRESQASRAYRAMGLNEATFT